MPHNVRSPTLMIALIGAYVVLADGPPAGCCDALYPFLDAAASHFGNLAAMLECNDNNGACPSWASSGECAKNPGFMRAECRKSCGACALAGEDLIAAQEIALAATRNVDLACKYAEATSTQLHSTRRQATLPACVSASYLG